MLRIPALRLFTPHPANSQAAFAASRATAPHTLLYSSSVYFERLDSVRAVAILWVFAYHFCGACWGWKTGEWLARWEESPAWIAWPGLAMTQLCRMGGLGVTVFFVLSGFLIHYTFIRGNQGIGQFWLRRWGRIYPPYLVALILLALVSGQLWEARGGTSFLHHLLFIHNYRDDFIYKFNPSMWSLAVEAQYYLLYPLLLGIRRAIGMTPVLAAAFVAQLAIHLLRSEGMISTSGDAQACLLLPTRYFDWILGMYVADCLLHDRQAFPIHRSAGWLCLAAAFAFHWTRWAGITVAPLTGLATAVWIDWIARMPARPGRFERLLFPLGVGSYSLYLWHQPIVNEVVARLVRNEQARAVVPLAGLTLLALLVAAGLTILVAAGSYRLLERPSIEVTKRLVNRCWPRPPAAKPLAQQIAA